MTLIGKVLAGRYEIIEEVGSGGMAVVYKAKCQLLNRFVAVKVLRPDLQNDSEFVRRFNVEAQAAASLTHPNIVSIYDVGNDNGLHYIVMEYIEGKTLKEYIEEKFILPWREAVDYAVQIAKGLEQAHKNSIIHRDIKPHNIIMTTDGVMKVTDFGIARANVQSTVTCDDSAIGSVHYISPEQARGGYTDERSDIYSLGVVLYEMLTGKVPFDSERPVTVAIMHLQEKPVMPREYNLSIPLALERIVLKAMSKEVSARYKTASEMIDELLGVLHDPSREIVAEEIEVPERENVGQTVVMPAVNIKDIKKEEPKIEEVVPAAPNNIQEEEELPKKPVKKNSQTVDKKKERKVIAFAIFSAIALILIISAGFMSITGMGGLFASGGNVEIPEIEGMLYDEAVEKYVENANENADFTFNIIKGKTVESDDEEGTILAQDPAAGTKVKKAEVIVITVEISEGKNDIRLKNYTKYQDAREVEIAVKDLGLEAEFIEEYSDDIPTGAIIKQEPKAGDFVKPGDVVTFYVSRGPEKEPEKTNQEDKKPENNPSTDTKTEEKQPEPQKKSSMLTLYGPKEKASALVQVNVNGKTVYSKTLNKGASDVVKLEGTSNSVEVEILHDGVSQQKGTVRLH
ncbi:MAG: Stk1 family PASTA domain-containing Ser/Thr kinase [Clostridia bacterium]|nr:Stk1 family PASTA domain-containing Ser/Thr kinase [Clostridia bacterium]